MLNPASANGKVNDISKKSQMIILNRRYSLMQTRTILHISGDIMTIKNIIKNTGLEIYLSYHPTILRFKREAKELHKQLKSQKVSLMQCQEIIVKRNGFNNWHHLHQELKKYYQEDLNKSNLIVSNDLEINQSYILGYDKIFNHYKYQSLDSSLTHRCFLGKGVAGNYDEFIAKQSIRLGCPVLFVSNKEKDENLNVFEDIITYARKIGRFQDIKKIGVNEYNLENNFNLFNASSLLEMFFNIMNDNGLNDGQKGRGINLLSLFFMYVKYKQLQDNQFILSLEKMKEIFMLEEHLQSNDPNLPQHIANARDSWIEDRVPEIETIFSNELDRLINLNLFTFKSNSIPLNLLENKNYIYLVSEDNLTCKILAILLKANMGYKLGAHIEAEEYINTPKKKELPYCIFFRNISLPNGFAVVPAQARSLGISMNIVYSELEDILTPEFQSLIANTNLKYLSHEYMKKFAHMLDINTLTVSNNKYVNESFDDYVNVIYKNAKYNITNKSI